MDSVDLNVSIEDFFSMTTISMTKTADNTSLTLVATHKVTPDPTQRINAVITTRPKYIKSEEAVHIEFEIEISRVGGAKRKVSPNLIQVVFFKKKQKELTFHLKGGGNLVIFKSQKEQIEKLQIVRVFIHIGFPQSTTVL